MTTLLMLPEPREATIKRLFIKRKAHQPQFKHLTKRMLDLSGSLLEEDSKDISQKDVDEIAFL